MTNCQCISYPKTRWAKRNGKNVGALYCATCDCFIRYLNEIENAQFIRTWLKRKAA